jgi:tetratricopeptide (TPR) repeat protein
MRHRPWNRLRSIKLQGERSRWGSKGETVRVNKAVQKIILVIALLALLPPMAFAMTPTWLERAKTLLVAEDWPGLLAHGRRWVKAEPGNDSAWFFLGSAYFELGQYREATEAHREALRLKDDATTWCLLASEYGELGRYREAAEALRQALRLTPDDADAWFVLGVAYIKLGRNREAIEANREAL